MPRTGKDTGGDYYFIEIKAKLPKGAPDLRRILSRIHRYDVIPWEEHYGYRMDDRKRSSQDSFQIKLWVRKKDYQPLANRLGKLDISQDIKITKIAPL